MSGTDPPLFILSNAGTNPPPLNPNFNVLFAVFSRGFCVVAAGNPGLPANNTSYQNPPSISPPTPPRKPPTTAPAKLPTTGTTVPRIPPNHAPIDPPSAPPAAMNNAF